VAQNLILSTLDRARLTEVLSKHTRESTAYVRTELVDKIRRAKLCAPTEIPPEIVTMNSRALLLTDRWPRPREYYLVYPKNENCLEQRISVLSPLGVALLGIREGTDLQVWDGKRVIDVLLVSLTYQPEAQKHWHL
jgi:regulator of nucleoside diphosphate kinase